jgi:predicted nucleic acid-binding protein
MRPARKDVVLDTGPLVALLDRRDQWHQRCAVVWPDLAPRCVTTEAVVTEATHLVARGGGPPSVVLELLLAGEVPIVGLEAEGHRRAARMMRQYESVPMDYADATLVVAAVWLRTDQVFTLDRRGFRTYRSAGDRPFSLLPRA